MVRAEDGLLPTSILDFRARLANRCKVLPVYALLRASILKFKPRFENQCKVLSGNSPKAASILDFMPRLGNRCKVFSGNIPKAASILDFMPRLENRCKVFPGNSPKAASILDFMPRLENHGKYCRWQRRMVSPAAAVAATMSASDSNLRCHEGEWPACSARRGNDLPRPILIFVAAKKNGSACNGRGGYEVRVRFHSSLPRRRMVPPAERHFPTAASILDFEARLENRCSAFAAATKNSPPAAQSWGAGRDRMPRRRHNPK